MKEETVEILMATYNGQNYLEEQINSILNQSHQNIRLLICDDHSSDETVKVIDKYVTKYPEKIVKIVSPKNLGAKGNFSFLMEHAKADYIMFSDQDDIWKTEKVAKTLDEMKRLEKVHGKDIPLLVHTDLVVVDQNCAVLGHSFWKYSNLNAPAFHTLNRFLMQNVVTGCTMMMNNRLCLLSVPVPQESLMHDWWIALVAAQFGKIGLVTEPTLLYRQHGKNTLGAQKFGVIQSSINVLMKFLRGDTHYQVQMLKRIAQAKAFLQRYQNELNPKEIKMVEDYFNLNDFSWVKKRVVVLKYKFFRSGFFRNFLTFMTKLNS